MMVSTYIQKTSPNDNIITEVTFDKYNRYMDICLYFPLFNTKLFGHKYVICNYSKFLETVIKTEQEKNLELDLKWPPLNFISLNPSQNIKMEEIVAVISFIYDYFHSDYITRDYIKNDLDHKNILNMIDVFLYLDVYGKVIRDFIVLLFPRRRFLDHNKVELLREILRIFSRTKSDSKIEMNYIASFYGKDIGINVTKEFLGDDKLNIHDLGDKTENNVIMDSFIFGDDGDETYNKLERFRKNYIDRRDEDSRGNISPREEYSSSSDDEDKEKIPVSFEVEKYEYTNIINLEYRCNFSSLGYTWTLRKFRPEYEDKEMIKLYIENNDTNTLGLMLRVTFILYFRDDIVYVKSCIENIKNPQYFKSLYMSDMFLPNSLYITVPDHRDDDLRLTLYMEKLIG